MENWQIALLVVAVLAVLVYAYQNHYLDKLLCHGGPDSTLCKYKKVDKPPKAAEGYARPEYSGFGPEY